MLSDRLSILMQQRSEWMNAKTQAIVENIANSDLKNARRREITPFLTLLERSNHARTKTGKIISDVKNFTIKEKDFILTNHEISRELEMMQLTRITTDHDGLMNIMKKFHQMYKTVLSKS